jgi:hypothetical protein
LSPLFYWMEMAVYQHPQAMGWGGAPSPLVRTDPDTLWVHQDAA